jgi:hypothetical protein
MLLVRRGTESQARQEALFLRSQMSDGVQGLCHGWPLLAIMDAQAANSTAKSAQKSNGTAPGGDQLLLVG